MTQLPTSRLLILGMEDDVIMVGVVLEGEVDGAVTAVPLDTGNEVVFVSVAAFEEEQSGGVEEVLCCLRDGLCPVIVFTICCLITVLLLGHLRNSEG